tara:strand:- start:6614 stop:6835 length:222 start_codon:yes stop_codon:yes gene_type:complete
MVFDHGAKARTSRSSLETKDPFPFDEDVRRRFVGGIAFDGGARSDCFSLSLPNSSFCSPQKDAATTGGTARED